MDSENLTQSIEGDALDGESVAPVPADEPVKAPPPATQRPPTVGQLRRERRRLWDLRQETVYHLGGLALDLYGRGVLQDELVALRAEVVAQMDRRLVELDELLAEADDRRRKSRVRAPDPVGYCMSCGAPHQAEAAFCFRCGARIHVPDDDGDTQVIAMPDTGAR